MSQPDTLPDVLPCDAQDGEGFSRLFLTLLCESLRADARVDRAVGQTFDSTFASEEAPGDPDGASRWNSDHGSDDEEDREYGARIASPRDSRGDEEGGCGRCVTCLDAPATRMCYPCMHLALCYACSDVVRTQAMEERRRHLRNTCPVPALIWMTNARDEEEVRAVQAAAALDLAAHQGLSEAQCQAARLRVLTDPFVPLRKMPRKRLFHKCVVCRAPVIKLVKVKRR